MYDATHTSTLFALALQNFAAQTNVLVIPAQDDLDVVVSNVDSSVIYAATGQQQCNDRVLFTGVTQEHQTSDVPTLMNILANDITDNDDATRSFMVKLQPN